MKNSLGADIEFIPVDKAYYKVLLLRMTVITILAFLIPNLGLYILFADKELPDFFWWIIWGVSLVFIIWGFWFIRRRAQALGYAELEEVLVIRRGVMFQSIRVVPYGRMQQINVNRGPLLSHFNLATVELVTASAESNASIPGLKQETAEAVRIRLTALGNLNKVEGL